MSGEVLLIAVLEARLTPRQREAFIDHDRSGRPFRAIAVDMGVSGATVGKLARNARGRLAVTASVCDARTRLAA